MKGYRRQYFNKPEDVGLNIIDSIAKQNKTSQVIRRVTVERI